jgi:hypothetical protein
MTGAVPQSTAAGPALPPVDGHPIRRGAVAGAIATAMFLVVHALLIMPIWATTLPMIISGAVCGACIAWSYRRVTTVTRTRSWLAMNGAFIATLFGLGLVSMVGFEPAWTFAELNNADPPIGDLLAASPLMAGFTVVAATLVWLTSGPSRASALSILVTEALLVLLLGHNVAIIGLVDLSDEGPGLVLLMYGLVAFLGLAYALAYLAIDRGGGRVRARRSTRPTPGPKR